MNNILIEEEIQNTESKNENFKNKKSGADEQFRVVISSEVNQVLEKLVKRVNDGFDGGEIAKSDVANFMLLNSWKSFSEVDLKSLRALHFDEKKMLRSILKQSSNDGELPEHLRKALREHYGLAESRERKISRKASHEESKE